MIAGILETFLAIFLASMCFLGCAPPAIGDKCESTYDCDIQGNRYCDLTQPDGYCTLGGCEKGTCPEDSDCILFRPKPDRLASTWCMKTCHHNSDCRDDYMCSNPDQLLKYYSVESRVDGGVESAADGGPDVAELSLAVNLDKEKGKICTVQVQE